MNTGRTRFKEGNKTASVQKGTKKKKTIIKETLGLDNLEALTPEVIKVWQESILSENQNTRFLAAKEISKYLFAQKRQIDGEMKHELEINIGFDESEYQDTSKSN